jgi:hypothetical protein
MYEGKWHCKDCQKDMQRMYIRIYNGVGKSYKFIPIGYICARCLLNDPDQEDYKNSLRIDKDLRTLYHYDWYGGVKHQVKDP